MAIASRGWPLRVGGARVKPLVNRQRSVRGGAQARRREYVRFLVIVGLLSGHTSIRFSIAQDTAENAPAGSAAPATAESAIDAALQFIEQMDLPAGSGSARPTLAELDKAVESAKVESPTDARLNYVVGRWHGFHGRQGDAVTALRKYVDSRDGRNDWRAHTKLGDLFVDQFPHLAKSSYEQANALKSDEPDVLFGLARCAEKLGRAPEAMTHARRLVEVSPTARHRAYLARLYFAQRQYEDAAREARGALELALEQEKGDPELAKDVDIDGFYRLLVDMQRTRLNENPSDPNDYLVMAKLITQRADNARRVAMLDAADVLKRGVEALKSEVPPSMYEALGVALFEAGRHEDARAAFLALRERDASNAVAAEWLLKLGDAENPPKK